VEGFAVIGGEVEEGGTEEPDACLLREHRHMRIWHGVTPAGRVVAQVTGGSHAGEPLAQVTLLQAGAIGQFRAALWLVRSQHCEQPQSVPQPGHQKCVCAGVVAEHFLSKPFNGGFAAC
jgi:hypothetical protein